MKPPEKLYKFHVSNLQEIDRAMESVARSFRVAIARDDKVTMSSFKCLYALLLGAWAECRLRKLLYEPRGFNESERGIIQSESKQIVQWQKAVELSFRKQYNVPKATLSSKVLPHSADSRYSTLSDMLENDLRTVIELRNKLAHGQWVYPLNSENDDIAQEQMDAIRQENLLSLQFKKNLLESLAAAIHDAVVSKPTFERDFDKHFRAIIQTRQNLDRRSYTTWVENLRQKYQRGKSKRAGTIP